VGVSNFEPDQLRRIVDETGQVPAVNQVEVHPYFTNEAVRAANASYDVATEAWSPIARGRVASDETIGEIAERVGRSPAQVTLRWHVQRGDIVFPKTTSPERMRENAAIFDFALSDADMAAISALDEGESGRTGPHPNEMDWIPR
jgi:2,5-diketo-D-gluconate reductase A